MLLSHVCFYTILTWCGIGLFVSFQRKEYSATHIFLLVGMHTILQALDVYGTGVVVTPETLSYEANPLLRYLMGVMGVWTALIVVKLVCMGVVITTLAVVYSQRRASQRAGVVFERALIFCNACYIGIMFLHFPDGF